MTEASKEAVDALEAVIKAWTDMLTLESRKLAQNCVLGLLQKGFTIAPIAPVTDEKLREAVEAIEKTSRRATDCGYSWPVIKDALSELAQRRAIIQEFVDICDKAPPIQLMHKIAELRGKLPTPPKED